jgi:DNA-directed RNA polymerase specialized sigma24 family protein
MSSAPSIGSDLRSALVAMVRKRVPESEVEDIVQSAIADALESPHAPTEAESFRRWIFGVAKNKVIDYHRRAVRETFDVPELPTKPVPHVEADLLRWAEKHLPPGEENKATLDWMLREGEGEKLEWIAETEKVPAPRIRQRVSRLRRHLKAHWQKEVALLAALGVAVTILVLVLRPKEPEPIANEDVPRAEEIRKQALERCIRGEWRPCVDGLDTAKRLDPAGDARPEVRLARENADRALRAPPPSPSASAPDDRRDVKPEIRKDSVTPPPAPTAVPSSGPMKQDGKTFLKPAPVEGNGKTAPAPKRPIGTKSVGTSSFDDVWGSSPPASKKKTAAPAKDPSWE